MPENNSYSKPTEGEKLLEVNGLKMHYDFNLECLFPFYFDITLIEKGFSTEKLQYKNILPKCY